MTYTISDSAPDIRVGVDYGTGISVEVFAEHKKNGTVEIIDVIETSEKI